MRLPNTLDKLEYKNRGRQWQRFLALGKERYGLTGGTWVQLRRVTDEQRTAQNTSRTSISIVKAGIITFEILLESGDEKTPTWAATDSHITYSHPSRRFNVLLMRVRVENKSVLSDMQAESRAEIYQPPPSRSPKGWLAYGVEFTKQMDCPN